jgi:poly(hydroxyalkanoate) depolymerase family esterase
MNSNPFTEEEAHRRRVVHRVVAEVAALDPDSDEYERRIAALADLIGQPELARRNESGWHGRWLPLRSRLAHVGQRLIRALRRTVTAGQARLDGTVRRAAGFADMPARSRFTEGRFGSESPRRYMLYEPASRQGGPVPLVVLLHGCQQGAEDFAAGTRMNEAAEAAGVVVLYPEQAMSANMLRCWNWYALHDRSNHEGDAALIAAMTRQVMHDHDIDASRVYVGGMSAGGAMAAVLARDYPKLYAALGVHSGVPAGLAHDVFSAMRLMSRGPGQPDAAATPLAAEADSPSVASIVFHGDEDTKVHLSNGQAIHAAPAAELAALDSLQATTHPDDGQRGFTRSVEFARSGVTQRELWIVHGAGHAWAGGAEQQRYTDATGPDASREMLRFFLQHRQASQHVALRRAAQAG